MRVAFLVVLILSAVLIERSESGWIKRAWQKVKNAAKKVVDWVKEHCSVGTGGINCSWNRRKRDADYGPPDANEMKSKQELCSSILEDNILLEQGFSFDVVKDVFEAVDRGNSRDPDGDDILDEEEFDEFMEALAVFHECFQAADRK